LIDELFNYSQELSRRRDPTEKSIVVSQFTCLLSIIQPILSESGVNWTRLDGSMSIRDRLAVIEEFQNPGKGTPTVLLLSLRAGNFDLSVIVLQTNFKRGKVFVVLFVY
jgi:SNF2 family DNA or RNA helicase